MRVRRAAMCALVSASISLFYQSGIAQGPSQARMVIPQIGVTSGGPQAKDSAISGTEPGAKSGVTPPRVIHLVNPKFTKEARKNKVSGVVLVNLFVDEQGRPTDIHVVHGLGAGLDEEAVKAISKYKFTPAKKNGGPVKVELSVEVNFSFR